MGFLFDACYINRFLLSFPKGKSSLCTPLKVHITVFLLIRKDGVVIDYGRQRAYINTSDINTD